MKRVFAIAALFLIPLIGNAQQASSGYYDDSRGGYVIRTGSKVTFTPALPPIPDHMRMRKEQIRLFRDVSVLRHPQLSYPYYMEMYPKMPGNNLVPVPIPGNPALPNR